MCFASESFTNLFARAGEVRDVVTRIALADRSCLDVTKLWRTPDTLDLQSEPQAVGDPLLLPVLIPPKDDRGKPVHPVEFKVQLGTVGQ